MKFKLQLIYICVVCFLCSCSLDEIYEQGKGSVSLKDGLIEVPFSISVPGGVGMYTKAMESDPDISTLHLVVFDDNGYYVETQEAEFTEDVTDHEHSNEKKYVVNLTQTDQPRKIHIVANCPVSQISYGHEAEIMSNLYVEGNATAYWGRIEVPHIMQTVDTDSDGRPDTYSDELLNLFRCVALLRNFSQIRVIDKAEPDNFEMTGFAVYNTVDKGTVVPYNKSTSSFQNFLKVDGSSMTYNELIKANYDGHALSSVTLKNTLIDKPVSEGGDFYAPGASFYMYERKVSVNSADESSWKESPPHIIIKGKYNNSSSETYYKIDLVRDVEEGGAIVKQYYNILRNFCYSFTINEIVDEGYSSLELAMANPAGNNLSTSTDTQGFTNLSDGLGRIFVEYTDMTLVTNNNVTLKYKYIPNIETDEVHNDRILVSGILDAENNPIGPVFNSYSIADDDDADGWRTITFGVNQVESIIKLQDVVLITTDNSNLNRTIKYTLRNYFPMTLECVPKKVVSGSGQDVRVDIKVPDDLTENLFPLSFDIEARELSLSPDATRNQLPVTVSKSIIPGKETVQTFHYTKKVTFDEYSAYTTSGGQTIIPTYFKTNKSSSASEVHAYNYYFRERVTNNLTAKDNFENARYSFSDIKPSSVGYGVGNTVSFSFDMQSGLYNREVTVTFDGLEDQNGNSTFKFTPTKYNDITISGATLKTTTPGGDVTVTIDASEYATAVHTITRIRHDFTGEFNGLRNVTSSNRRFTFSFEIPEFVANSGDNMDIYITAERCTVSAASAGSYSAGKLTLTRAQYDALSNKSVTLTLDATDQAISSRSVSITLKSDGYNDKQFDGKMRQTATINKTFSAGTLGDVSGGSSSSVTCAVTITLDDNYKTSSTSTVTRSGFIWYTYSYSSFQISNWTIEYTDTNQQVTITLRYNQNDYVGTCTVQDLLNSGNLNVNLTRNRQ